MIVSYNSCLPTNSNKDQQKNKIIIREAEDPAAIHPLLIRDEIGFYLSSHIFQPLLAIDYRSEELVGVLADGRPMISSSEKWDLIIDYRIRKGAAFQKGYKVNYNDVLFSLKTNASPLFNPFFYSSYAFIDSIAVNSADSSQFSIYSNHPYQLAEFVSGDYFILPEQQFDPNQLLRNYSLKEIQKINAENAAEELLTLQEFIENKNFRQTAPPLGSGPYLLESWNNSQQILLKRKPDWWAKDLDEINSYFRIRANLLQYQFIDDDITATNALRNGEIDLMRSISAREFRKLKNDSAFLSRYHLKTTPKFAYQYLGFNLSNPHLKHLELRKAIAFSLPTEKIIEKVYYGMAEKVLAPFILDGDLNTFNLHPYQYNRDSAKYYHNKYLNNNDINNITLTYTFNSGNQKRKAVGLILKESLKALGIELNLEQYEWSVYLQKLKAGELELFFNGVVTSALPPDLSNSFHSSAIAGGRNYFHYSDQKSDSLMDSLQKIIDKNSRNRLIAKLQKRLNRQLPMIPLMKPIETLAFSKKLNNIHAYRLRPNYWAPELSLEAAAEE